LANPDPTNDVDEQAARWAARASYGEMTAENRAELTAWLSADRRNGGAYLRAKAGLYAMEDAVTQRNQERASDNDNALHSSASLQSRFRRIGAFMVGGAALAACFATVMMFGVPHMTPAPQANVVATRTMNLQDGSIATLQPGARIDFAMADGTRKVTLISGHASFAVAKDRSRPFVVRSGDVYAQATGTVYSVRRLGSAGAAVSVTEGSVLVWARNERDQAVLLHAGDKLALHPAARTEMDSPLSPAARAPVSPPPPELAQIALDNVPIASAVDRFNRVNRVKIVISDPTIAETRIVGLFNASDPERFAAAAAAITGAHTISKNDKIEIKMK
jgi:transmembrane sensor